MIDYSRAVPAYYLGLDAPDVLRTALMLRQYIWRKEDPRWHICGIPDIFYTDNGSDYRSKHMEQVSADIKMRLVFSIRGQPRGRGKIERFFETVNQLLLSGLPGYMPEGKFPPDGASLTMKEFEKLFLNWLLTDYHMSIHSETTNPPQDRWESGAFLPRLPESAEQLDLLLLTVSKSRRIRPDGIHFQRFRYMSTTLAGYVGEDVVILYDPRDLAQIRVYHNNSFLCVAACEELSGITVGLKEIIRSRNRRKRELDKAINDRTKTVDLFLSVHQPETNSKNPDPEPSESTEDQPVIRRYFNE